MKSRGTRYAAVIGISTMLAFAGCKKDQPVNESLTAAQNATDPSGLNLLQVPTDAGAPATTAYRTAGSTQVLGQSYSAPTTANGEDYTGDYADVYNDLDGTYDPYEEYVDTSVPYAEQAPPPLPEYEQPYAPGPDYIWTPGYWDYAPTGYYWVPGAWVQPPYIGALWTPGWWGYYGGRYRFHHGYWGRNVGFYGGINFGFGYIGIGYAGGYWSNDHFYYNRAYNRVNPVAVRNYVYDRRVTINNRFIDNHRVSYWGGPNGIRRAPVRAELIARSQHVTPPMRAQVQNRQFAQRQPQQFFAQNHGRPQTFAARTELQADRGIQRPPAMTRANIQSAVQNMHQERQRLVQQRPQMQRTNIAQPNRPNMPNNVPRQIPGQPGNAQRQGFGNMSGRNPNPQQQNLTPQQRQTLERLHGPQGAANNNHQIQQQQRVQQMEQNRQQQLQQRQQTNLQHQQQNIQRQQENVQRQQANQQRAQQLQQRQQQMQQREQQRAATVQQTQQRQQMEQQRQQQTQQRAQQNLQRQQAEQQRAQQMQQRQQQQQQHQQQMQQHQVQHMQAPQRPQAAPQTHGGAPHGNPHGEEHHH